MSGRRGLPVQIIVADTGPLITLAACGRLDLLLEFRLPVNIPDVIKAECLRYPDKIGAATLEAWFASPNAPVRIIATPVLAAWTQAVTQEAADPASHASVGIGDASTAWLLRQMHAPGGPQGPFLVLTEDGPFGDGILRDSFREAHVLSTRAFLRALENYGRIPSAQAVIAEVADAGRLLSKYMADRPGRPEPGTKTSWADVLAQRSSGVE